MRYLPESIRNQLTGQPLELHRLEYFYEQVVVRHYIYYGLGHFVLATYAALPALLTSDLLYKIWLNFKYYRHSDQQKMIHQVAPADVLLSGLLEEISPGYFQMPEPVRQALLHFWDQCYKGKAADAPIQFQPVDQVAEFLKDYARFDFSEGAIGDRAFREAQEWTADSYLDPSAALQRVATAYELANSDGERLRYQDAINKMAGRLSLSIAAKEDALGEGGPFQPIIALSHAMQALVDREPDAYQKFLDKTSPEVLSDHPSTQPGHISVQIPERLQRGLATRSADGKLRSETFTWALVVGMSGPPKKEKQAPEPEQAKTNEDESYNDALDMASCIKGCLPEDAFDLKVLVQNSATKQAILDQLKRIAKQCAPQDHIIVYFSACANKEGDHCFLNCADSLPLTESLSDKSSFFWDTDFRDALQNVECGRVTLILEAQFSASKYWVDIEKGHVLLANCHLDQNAYFLKDKIDEKSRSPFTYALVSRLLANKSVSIQKLFNDTLHDFYDTKAVQKTYGIETVHASQNPQLLATKDSLHSPFFFNNKSLPLLQRRLRQAGYYNGDTHGVWTSATAAGYAQFSADERLSGQGDKQRYIEQLEGRIARRDREVRPVFLLVFSDPEKLADLMMEEERKQIEKILEPYLGQIQVVTLQTPSAEALQHQFCSINMRDRVAFFYFSGFGDLPGLKLGVKEDLSAHEFLSWIPFQERLQAVVINRCNSTYLAERLSQAGVQVAIGAPEPITEEAALRAGTSLVDGLLRGEDLDKILDDLNPKTR